MYTVVTNPASGLLDRKISKERLQSKLQRKHEKKPTKNDKMKGTIITQSTCQKKIEQGLLIERVWYSASREPSDTLPGSQPCAQTHSIYSAGRPGGSVGNFETF